MSTAQGPGGALEPHYNNGGGFGPPPNNSSKEHYNSNGGGGNNASSTTNSNGGSHLTELTNNTDTTTHLTLLKNAPVSNSSSSPNSNTNSSGLPSFTSFGDTEGLGSRLSDAFSEIRYAELQHWDLNTYSTEGLTARLIDTRSIDNSENGPDHYRPWEKPDSNNTTQQSPTSSTQQNNNAVTLVSTTTANNENGISSTNGNDKSPTTLTPLTNVFPTFSETFSSNGQKLPSFQSQFNSFQEPPPLGHPSINGSHIVDLNGVSSLPSFHTLPANRGYVHTPTHTPIHHGSHGPTMISSQPQHHHQFLEERHIQIFPGQVQIGPGQFGQLIATTTSSQPTMTITTNGHHLSSPHVHHHFNGNGINGGGNFGGISAPPTPSPAAPSPASTPGGTLQELVPVPSSMHTLLHPTSLIANNNNSNKLTQQTTDGNLPSLNLNIIHHDPHHHSPHGPSSHHLPSPHLNINMPKYLHGAGVSNIDHMHPNETHLIAVKLNPYEHSPHGQINPNMLNHHHQQQQQQQQMPPHLLHHQPGGGIVQVHHQITKLEQCSPQIVSTNNNGNGNNGNGPIHNNGTNHSNGNGTPKRQVNRKRRVPDHSHHHSQGILGDNGINHLTSHDLNDPQVSSVSSTDSDFKRPNLSGGMNGNGINGNGHHHGSMSDGVDAGLEKPVKKKRKRCGECTGCQRKDNCGDCAPCRNDKSHQICKMRRCDKLTEKKTPKVKLKQQQH